MDKAEKNQCSDSKKGLDFTPSSTYHDPDKSKKLASLQSSKDLSGNKATPISPVSLEEHEDVSHRTKENKQGTRSEIAQVESDIKEVATTDEAISIAEASKAVPESRLELGPYLSVRPEGRVDVSVSGGEGIIHESSLSPDKVKVNIVLSCNRSNTDTAVLSDEANEEASAEPGTIIVEPDMLSETPVSKNKQFTNILALNDTKETSTHELNTKQEMKREETNSKQETNTPAFKNKEEDTMPALNNPKHANTPGSSDQDEIRTFVSHVHGDMSTLTSSTRHETDHVASNSRQEASRAVVSGGQEANTIELATKASENKTERPDSSTVPHFPSKLHGTDGEDMVQEKMGIDTLLRDQEKSKASQLKVQNVTCKSTHSKIGLNITHVEQRLLCTAFIRNDLFWTLSKGGCEVNKEELEKGHILVEQENAATFWHIFRSRVVKKAVPLNPGIKDMDKQISKIAHRFSDKLKVAFDKKTNLYNFAFHRDVESELMQQLDTLSMIEKSYCLPSYLVSFINCHLQYFTNSIQEQMPFPVKLEVKIHYFPATIAVRSDGYPKLQKVLDRLFSDLQYTKMNTSERALFLQTTLGNELVKEIESKYHCQLRIRSPGHEVVLRAVSPGNRHFILCDGNIQYTDHQVLVLPLSKGQTEWCPEHKQILDQGFYSTNVKVYAARLGPPPKKQFTFPLKPTVEGMERHVVVMYVPEPTSEKMKGYIRDACTEALDYASSQKLSLAFPIKLSDGLSLKTCLKAMLYSIREHMQRKGTLGDVALYVRDNLQLTNLVHISSECLSRCEGWVTDIILRAEPPSVSSHRIKIAVDELQKFKADVLVNSTDPELNHEQGTVSKLLLQTVVPNLKDLCHESYPKGIENRILAVTETTWLKQWKEIHHVVLRQCQWNNELEDQLLGELRKRVQGCLIVASAKNHTSIAFPTLGTGTLNYPPEKVAHTMFKAARDFFALMPHSSLKEVNIVCFPKDAKIIQVFKAEEALHTLKVSRSSGKEARLQVRNTLVQIIVCDTDKEKIPTLCHIGFDFDHESEVFVMTQKGRTKCSMKSLNETLKEETKKGVTSLQINLKISGSEDCTAIVKFLESMLLDCPKCLHVIMTVPNMDSLHNVCGKFQAAQKGNSYFPWLRMRASKSQRKAVMIPPCSERPYDFGVIYICGKVDAVDGAVSEIMKIVVPKKYSQLAAELNAGDSVDPVHPSHAVKSHDKYVGVPQKSVDLGLPKEGELSHLCSFTIPAADLNGLEKSVFIDETLTPKHVILRDGHLKCYVLYTDLKAAVNKVVERIKSADAMSQKRNLTLKEQKDEPLWERDDSTSGEDKQNPVIEKTVDLIEYEALEYLLGEAFTCCVTKIGEKDGRITFSLPLGRCPEEKIDSLRQETVSLEDSDLSKLGSPIIAQSEGVEAYMKIIQQENKVIILCFDYSNMNKAKHLLQVKIGKLKPTSRGNRKFVEESFSSSSKQPLIQFHSQPADNVELNTSSGIKIFIYKTDITKLPVDAIVNAANGHLQHGGGVAAAIAKAAGPSLEEEGDDYVTKHGPLKVTQVMSTSPGALPCKTVLHAVGPCWDDYQDKKQCQQDLQQTVFNCLETAHSMKLASLAVSSISSAIFRVPKDVCAEMYLQAVQRFDDQYGKTSCLRHIHFVDISDEMVSKIKDIFLKKWNSAGHKMQPVTSVDLAQQNATDLTQAAASVNGRQLNKTENEHLCSPVNNTLHNVQEKKQSDILAENAQHEETNNSGGDTSVKLEQQDVKEATKGVGTTWQNVTGTTSNVAGSAVNNELHVRSDLQNLANSNTELPLIKKYKIPRKVGGCPWQFHFQFRCLNLVIEQECIVHMKTDAVIFWHTVGYHFDEILSQRKFISSTDEFSTLKNKKWTAGEIYAVKSSKATCLIVAVPSLKTDSMPAVSGIIEVVLDKVDSSNLKSLALPRLPGITDIKQDSQNQAIIFYSMARFAEKCARSLKEVYVVDPDESYILSVVNNISSYAQTVMSYADTKRLEDTRLSSSATQGPRYEDVYRNKNQQTTEDVKEADKKKMQKESHWSTNDRSDRCMHSDV